MAAKTDNVSPAHLEWLVASRAANQQCAITLLKLFERFPVRLKSPELSKITHYLVSVCFSLWRAAFLADKTGQREAVFEDTKAFLTMLLVDNAIAYAQDRRTREWTFNYYMNSATDGLLYLSRRWPPLAKVLSDQKRKRRGTTKSERRWERHQRALDTAIQYMDSELNK
ncbi:MAG TPA: hypothetical protein VK989_01430 [Polyangia bacterium]|jgi:hypothetical protein|nr:hypothetical protein [Polyangia bacterium]